MDHTQLHSVTGRPLMISSFIVPCFKMVLLQTLVRANGDSNLQRIQENVRLHYSVYDERPELLQEFTELVSNNCVFVDSWYSPEITPITYCLYGKRYLAKEASRHFVEVIFQRSDIGVLSEHQSDDVENP
eukprot:537862-Ditylum_brightwellii.AAC.1